MRWLNLALVLGRSDARTARAARVTAERQRDEVRAQRPQVREVMEEVVEIGRANNFAAAWERTMRRRDA